MVELHNTKFFGDHLRKKKKKSKKKFENKNEKILGRNIY